MSWKCCWLCCDCKSRGVCPKEGCKQRQPHHGVTHRKFCGAKKASETKAESCWAGYRLLR
jgi:hypothetical protein